MGSLNCSWLAFSSCRWQWNLVRNQIILPHGSGRQNSGTNYHFLGFTKPVSAPWPVSHFILILSDRNHGKEIRNIRKGTLLSGSKMLRAFPCVCSQNKPCFFFRDICVQGWSFSKEFLLIPKRSLNSSSRKCFHRVGPSNPTSFHLSPVRIARG